MPVMPLTTYPQTPLMAFSDSVIAPSAPLKPDPYSVNEQPPPHTMEPKHPAFNVTRGDHHLRWQMTGADRTE